jgi:F420-dependent oxidoreductase-like protein
MDIGLILPSTEHATIDHLVDSARAAADSGLASLWLTHSTGYDPLTAISVIGREVSGITLGSAVTPVQTVHPARLASQARTANAAIGGRLILGIGVAHRTSIEGRFGLSFERPVTYLSECLDILRPLIDGHKVDITGRLVSAHLRLTDEGMGGVPIMIAALQPRMLAIAGSRAEGTITWCCGVRTIRERIVPTVRAAAVDAGRDMPAVVVALPVCVTDDSSGGRAAAYANLRGYEQLPVYRAVLDEEGAANAGDVAVVGDETNVRDQLRELADAGCTSFAAISCGDDASRARTMQLLSDVARNGL